MSVAAAVSVMTTEQMLALPENGSERWLIRGRLRERARAFHRWHSRALARLACRLQSWRDQQPEVRGAVLCGEVTVRLVRDPDTTIGVDLVYTAPDMMAQPPAEGSLVDGVPLLVVEILSPKGTRGQTHERIDTYLEAGVRLVWVIDPHNRTVLVHRPGAEPALVSASQELTGGAELPGFRVRVAELFA